MQCCALAVSDCNYLQRYSSIALFVACTIIHTDATFSIVAISTLALFDSKACVRSFVEAPPEVFKIFKDQASVFGYIDLPVVIMDVKIRHTLFVVQELAFPL